MRASWGLFKELCKSACMSVNTVSVLLFLFMLCCFPSNSNAWMKSFPLWLCIKDSVVIPEVHHIMYDLRQHVHELKYGRCPSIMCHKAWWMLFISYFAVVRRKQRGFILVQRVLVLCDYPFSSGVLLWLGHPILYLSMTLLELFMDSSVHLFFPHVVFMCL